MRFLRRSKKAKSAAVKVAAPRRSRRRALLGKRTLIAGGAILLLLGAGIGAWQWQRSAAGSVMIAALGDATLRVSAGFGLTVEEVEVEGRVMTARDSILRAVATERGAPILAVSPVEVQARLQGLPWVRAAEVERVLPGTLRIRLAERVPFAFWQRQGRLMLIDRDGTIITDEHLERFPNLIVLVGEDAPRQASSLIDMLATEPDLAGRVVAAVRVGGRRWNLRLDSGIDVELPEEGGTAAWAQLAKMERTSRLLARDVQAVDLRIPDRLVLRVAPEPPKEPQKKGRQAAKST